MNETQRLTQRLKDQQKLQDQERKGKKKKPNVLMEEETGEVIQSFDFWCDVCQEDFIAHAYKTKHRLYGDTVAVWRAVCPECEEECIRHITHKDEDTYYYKSAKVRRQRNEYATDLLQADDYGFKLNYGNPNKDIENTFEKKEIEIFERNKFNGLKGDSLQTKEYRLIHAKKMQGK